MQWQSTTTLSTDAWFQALGLVSFCGYVFIAMAIYFNKQLQVHPMNLIYYMTLFDAASVFVVYSSYNIC